MSQTNCSPILEFQFNKSNYNILIIEDSKSINKIISKKFSSFGYNCLSAFNLKEAYQILDNKEIHYVMLDVHLPDGNGYELIVKLENTPEKIFVLTTETDKQFREVSYQKGVIDFIVKDNDFLQKLNEIDTMIEQLEKNKYKTILIIDDSIVIQEQLKEILSNRFYNIKIASNDHKALDILKQDKIDLILLDLNLNNVNGLDFLKENKVQIIDQKKIPVLIISGTIESSTIRDALKIGAVDVIRKPYVVEEIILKVDLWIDYNRREQEILCSNQLLEQYKSTVDRSLIVSKTTPLGIITYVNDEFCKITGYSEAELLGQAHNIVRHPDNSKDIFKDMWHTIKDMKQPWKGDIKNKKKDGTPYWVKTVINPILDVQGDIIEYIGIRTDITEQEILKEHFKTRLNKTTDNFKDAIKLSQQYEMAINESSILSRSDLQGNITYINDKFCKVTGYTREEVMGKNYSILKDPDVPAEFFKELWDTISSGKVWKGIFKNRKKNKESYWVKATIVPIKNHKNEIFEYMSIRDDVTELFTLHNEIEETQREIVYKMGEIGETRSKETGNHVKRVAQYSKELALLYGLDKKDAEVLFAASPMHDIGKVGIPDAILKKPGKLTDDEFKIMKAHSVIGYNILKGSTREVLQAAAIVAFQHHEKYDGTGYPKKKAGEDIHIFGRITAIADVFDALGSARCYKEAWEDERIFKLFHQERGKHFDPKLVDLFFENLTIFLDIRDKYQD